MPKSVPHLVLDKVRLFIGVLFSTEKILTRKMCRPKNFFSRQWASMAWADGRKTPVFAQTAIFGQIAT